MYVGGGLNFGTSLGGALYGVTCGGGGVMYGALKSGGLCGASFTLRTTLPGPEL